MVEEFIELNHVALCASTGSDVIGVFHTLSLGKTGHGVRGNVVAGLRAFKGVFDHWYRTVAEAVGTLNVVATVNAVVPTRRAQCALVTISRDRLVDSPHHMKGAVVRRARIGSA